jgi:hypothetical protein
MSVQNEIDRIISAVAAAHKKVEEKGGVTSTPYLVGNLATAIDSIPEGKDSVLQNKTVTPTTSKQTITADSGYDGLDTVTVNAMPTATQATPSITVSSGGLITAKSTQTAGYVASGTKQATKQLTTQAAKTITPSENTQTAVASGVYTTGAVTVAAIPDTYVQPSGTLNITANGTHDVKNYESVVVNVAGSGDGVDPDGPVDSGGSYETVSVSVPSASGVMGVATEVDPETGKIITSYRSAQKIAGTIYRNVFSKALVGSAVVIFKGNITSVMNGTVVETTSTYTIIQATAATSGGTTDPGGPGGPGVL